jgi:hypothetical protein
LSDTTVPPKKPGVAFWATVVLVAVPVLYVFSFGPACWIVARADENTGADLVNRFYHPVLWAHNQSFQQSGELHQIINWYALTGCGRESDWGLLPIDWDGPVMRRAPEFFWYHDAR